jgi:hypothetical protein
MYIITPSMVSRDGVKTPGNVPNLFDFAIDDYLIVIVKKPNKTKSGKYSI